ncbi:MAG: peptidylprolyl isomerase [Erysipelotrichaceae bacterium]
MKKFLKENWFVAVIALFFISISIYYAYDQNKDNLPAKTVNGKDVVATVDDVALTADDLYDKMYKTYGKNQLFLAFYKGVIDSNVEVTSEMESEINSSISQTVSYYQTYYGYGIDYLNLLTQQYYGYNTFSEYVEYSIKSEKLFSTYIEEHADEFVTDEFVSENKPRVVSYCLIKMEDPENPTDDDLSRLQTAQQAWQNEFTAETFAEFAKLYSEDESTAAEGGVLGYIDVNSSLVDAFLEAALQLDEHEVSEWIFDENYGYFLIKCDSTQYEDYKTDANFISTILYSRDNLSNEIVWQYAQDANVKFANDDLKNYIMEQLNVESED